MIALLGVQHQLLSWHAGFTLNSRLLPCPPNPEQVAGHKPGLRAATLRAGHTLQAAAQGGAALQHSRHLRRGAGSAC